MTPEELNQLKAIAASCDTQKRLNELIAQHTPVRKVRDGFREPKKHGTYFTIDTDGCGINLQWFNDEVDKASLALGRCFEHRHNAEMVAEQNRLMATFIRWIDEHGADALNPGLFYTVDNFRGGIRKIIGVEHLIMPIKIDSGELADQFIRENEADLKKYFENEETLRRTLHE